MGDPFVHLHVASGYSMRHGASHPDALVGRAAEHGMDTLALTDRDGVYGAVRFVTSCVAVGIRPVLGVDLAIGPDAPPQVKRAPRGVRARQSERDGRLPRATLLAVGGRGWSSVCRLTSATHLEGERGTPVSSLRLIERHGESVVALLGPDSALGRLVAARRPAAAAEELARWRAVVPTECLFVELVHHREEGTAALMRRLAAFAAEHDVPTVLTNAVRFADRSGAPVADALDAIRRLVPLTSRHVDATNAEAELKSGKEMRDLAEELTGSAADARRLLARTRILGERCVLDPKADLGIGTVHFPELAAGVDAAWALRQRCDGGLARRGLASSPDAVARLEAELEMVQGLGYPSYFLTVADVVDMVKSMGIRCAARGSGAGSLVNYALGISDVDPMRYGLLMERFLSPYRKELPDIDLDVESARRLEVYDAIFDRFGGDRVACVSMMDTYRVRHAIRDVGGALGLPPGEIDLIAKSFPHISARHVRAALAQLPELQASGLGGSPRLEQLYTLVEQLDGLPRHVAMHPCGVLLSDATLLDRTPVEASYLGYPMSQFDKDDVEQLGLLKLDVLGIRMQSTIAYALSEIERVDGESVDVDAVPRDDPATYALVQSTRTLGMFQIESPGQRELVGKFAPETFNDLIIDISLFRPGPVKTDMVTPFLQARHGWRQPVYLHDDLRFALAETYGVVVFHEQVLQIVATMTGCSLSEADEVRRALSDPEGIARMRAWFRPLAARRGYPVEVIARAWEVLEGFAAFGFCKAHAAAFALPTYQSAWLKAHHPAAFLAGVLTHDPGMYPKRLILDDARQFGIAVLPLDVNLSDGCYRVEHIAMFDRPPPSPDGQLGLGSDPAEVPAEVPAEGLPGARRYGIRLSLADVKGITDAEVARIVGGRPYGGLSD
ncbi:MAG: error-prone polymerase, partial [Frankiaceae bacterium]|nr:error-prone polymerase [Frankiaceae bacterium]